MLTTQPPWKINTILLGIALLWIDMEYCTEFQYDLWSRVLRRMLLGKPLSLSTSSLVGWLLLMMMKGKNVVFYASFQSSLQ